MKSLPQYKESRILVQSLFDPLSLSEEDMDWYKKRVAIKPSLRQRSPRRKRSKVKENRQRRILESDGQYTQEEWVALKQKYGFKCLRCEVEGEKLYPDHIRSLCKDGSNLIHNIQPLCFKCNFWKGPFKIVDFRPPEDQVPPLLLYKFALTESPELEQ